LNIDVFIYDHVKRVILSKYRFKIEPFQCITSKFVILLMTVSLTKLHQNSNVIKCYLVHGLLTICALS